MSDETRILASVLDALIPASHTMPCASALGLEETVRERLGEEWAALLPGLEACEVAARARGAEGFVALAQEDAAAALEEVAANHPAFLGGLVFQAYTTYYEHPRVVEALGLEARPPWPGGYPLETGDLDRLARVREGPRRYREC